MIRVESEYRVMGAENNYKLAKISLWRMFVARGVLALIMSVLFYFTSVKVDILILQLGGYIFLDGCISIWMGGLSHQKNFMVFGSIAVLIGVYAFYPVRIDNFCLLSLVCAWAWLRGIFEIAVATKFYHKEYVKHAFIGSGVLCVVIGAISACLHPSQVSNLMWFFSIFYFSLGCICLMVGIHAYRTL